MKRRIDQLLVEKQLAPSRERAQALIMAGHVLVNEVPVTKPGHKVDDAAPIRLRGQDHPYVGRGGVKLAAALDHFKINPTGQICADIGASTGGFTDCLLQRGAAKIFAIDVGHNQLAWKLRQEPRVVCLEGLHVRDITMGHFSSSAAPQAPTLIVVDCSFISLTRVLPEIARWAPAEAQLIALIKPQFEVGPENVGKGGIVRDDSLRQSAITQVERCLQALGWKILGVIPSPITGSDGNIEYLIAALVQTR